MKFLKFFFLVIASLVNANLQINNTAEISISEFDILKGRLNENIESFDDKFAEFKNLSISMSEYLLKEKEDVEKMKKMAKKYESIDADIIKLNVGGTYFSTLKSTLEKKIKKRNGNGYYDPNLFQSLLSGTIKINYDENKAIFIDRNPKYFNYILDYLRNLDSKKQFDPTKVKIESINEFLTEIEYYELNGLIDSMNMDISSVIIKTVDDQIKLRTLCGFDLNLKWKLLYRASVDGFRAADFHRKCDNNANTLTIIKTTENYVFGGYTKATWNQHGYGTYQSDSTAFIFSFINRENTPLKMEIKSGNYNNAIYSESSYGPTFGGHDFIISNSSNNNRNSYSNLGHSYKFDKYTYGSNGAQQFLAGSYNFQVSEIEVFQKA
jgi:hypothetical protein